MHLLVALIAGAFMVILVVTGGIMEFEPELDRSLHPQLSHVVPGTRVRSLGEIGDAVSSRFGGEPVVAFVPSLLPTLPYQVLLSRGVVYVNQYTGEILGERMRGQSFLGYVRALHSRLALGSFGGKIPRWSAAAMFLSLTSGLCLWWPTKRFRIPGKLNGRPFWRDLHNSIGIFSLLPLTMLAATGTVLGFEDQIAPMISKLSGSSPTQIARKQPLVPDSVAASITPDEAVRIARSYVPNAEPYRIQMPRYGGVYQIALVSPRDRITGDRNVVVLNPLDGSLLLLSRSSDLSRGDRILAINEAIHTGSILGMPSRIGVFLASAMGLVQVSSGIIIWLFRKKFIAGAK
jgi:uncharacterized iron-regulated membrane protein